MLELYIMKAIQLFLQQFTSQLRKAIFLLCFNSFLPVFKFKQCNIKHLLNGI